MNRREAKKRIEAAISKYTKATSKSAYKLVPKSLTNGKLYEAHVLSKVIERLHTDEGFTVLLVNSRHVTLKSSPGPINRHFPRFELYRGGTLVAELWTDVEFLSMSYSMARNSGVPDRGQYHELDIVLTDPNLSDRPAHDKIWMGVECKNTGYNKGLLKEILGVRRELSLLHNLRHTKFRLWPRTQIQAEPPSCLLVYSTDPTVLQFQSPGDLFGIDFVHEQF